jgi:hypothetical protein
VILEELAVDAGVFEARTGWAIKPQGACKGEVCVPLPAMAQLADGRLDPTVLAERLGMPLVTDERRPPNMRESRPDTGRPPRKFGQVWALGPETAVTGRSLTTAVAPELVLPDADGNPFRLSSLRGQKVLLVAWASW